MFDVNAVHNTKSLISSVGIEKENNLSGWNRTNPMNLQPNSRKSTLTSKMDYSSVVKMNLPPNAYSQTVQPQHIQYTDEPKATSPGVSLEEYGRALHRMGESNREGTAELAESILIEILDKYTIGSHNIRPDGACYNSVIHAYAEEGKAEKAESVLRLMFKDYQDGNEKAEPNVRVYTNVLHAWRKTKAANAPERCEAILKEMYELSDTGILPACKPDTFAVTVSKFRSCCVRTIIMNSPSFLPQVLLHCWTESNRKGAAVRAESIFRKMKNRFLAGEQAQCPDCIAYSIVLNKFAQESMYDGAEGILFEMVEDFLSGNDSAKPRTSKFHSSRNILFGDFFSHIT